MEKEKKTIKCSYAVLVIILFAALCFVTDYAIIESKMNKCSCPDCSASGNTNVAPETNITHDEQNGDVVFLTNTELKFGCEDDYIKVENGNITIDIHDKIINIDGFDAKYVYAPAIMTCENYRLYFLTEQGNLFQILINGGLGYDVNLIMPNVSGIIDDHASEHMIINNKTFDMRYLYIMTSNGSYSKIYWQTFINLP